MERLAISAVAPAASGTVTSAMSASSGEIQSIITRIAITIRMEFSNWEMVCCNVCDRLSRSLVTRLSRSPRAVVS
ncbi:Uncharacterised protein [Mycobacteroides abscessus subsp. abscessus]|nr:Uncharacterised protein [Mycobacteroides abscessus subsp. abscessus]